MDLTRIEDVSFAVLDNGQVMLSFEQAPGDMSAHAPESLTIAMPQEVAFQLARRLSLQLRDVVAARATDLLPAGPGGKA